MRLAICPGSFDPVTNGHLDVIQRAARLFDRVVVLVAVNMGKHGMFTVDERCEMLRRATTHLPNVEVAAYNGLLADYARERQAAAIVKGLRAMSDFEYEFQMALTNRKLNSEVETVFLTTSTEYMYLSSSLVKEVARLGGDVSEFVPACVVNDILNKTERTEKNDR
ncbi:MAG: pantetheine-phosphate adenylyltransferase [Ruminococcaceae bacterium]|nr:pantetheine-phosphate adenylyltransferase [Oscillospiraceae bacterium]